ncbi:MAG: DUF2190 family protein [Candidatus Omnitrophica bacterium]|nr:DUF2190 family protein [Candidatus Omnitrophota bacterium]
MKIFYLKITVFLLMMFLATNLLADSTPVYDQASDIETNTSGFSGNLSSADTTVQKALDTIDDLTLTSSLSALADVTITSISNNQLIKYNSTSGKWENWTPNYLTSFTETDPVWTADKPSYSTTANADLRYLKLDQSGPQTLTGLSDGYLKLTSGVLGSEAILWQKVGTTLSPTTAGDSLAIEGGILSAIYSDVGGIDSSLYGVDNYAEKSESGSVGELVGFFNSSNIAALTGNTVTGDTVYGNLNYVQATADGVNSSAVITAGYGAFSQLSIATTNSGTSIITDYYNNYLANAQKSGTGITFDNFYQLYIETPTQATNNYSIYSAGGNNVLLGNLAVGTSDLDGTPAIGRLTVKGTTNDGSTNIFVGRDSDEANIATLDSDGKLYLTDKLILTQSDGNEYIDSLADGYIDIEATTGIRQRINGVEQINLVDGKLAPTTTLDIDLGDSTHVYKDGYLRSRIITSTPADTTYSGTAAAFTAGENLTRGQLVYYKSDGKVWKAKADATSTMTCMGIVTADASADASVVILLDGFIKDATLWNFTSGGQASAAAGLIYVSEATAGLATQTKPSTATNIVQIVGFAIDADTIRFSPDKTYITVS